MDYMDFSDVKFYRAFKRAYLAALEGRRERYILKYKGRSLELLTLYSKYALQYAEGQRARYGLPILFPTKGGKLILRAPRKHEKESIEAYKTPEGA